MDHGLYDHLPLPNSKTTTEVKPAENKWAGLSVKRKESTVSAPTALKPRAIHVKPQPQKKPVKKASSSAPSLPLDSSESLESDGQSLHAKLDDQYDPAKPNDYEDFVEERKVQKQRQSEADRERELELKESLKPKNAEFQPPASYFQDQDEDQGDRAQEEDIDGTAWQAEPSPKKKSKKVAPNNSNGGSTGANPAVAKMMANMGYKQGHGLGRLEQGITTPLVAKKIDKGTAVIVGGKKSQEPQRQRPRVVLLTNMVGRGQVDDELQSEIEREASKYGRVVRCTISEDATNQLPDDQAVRIFIEFSSHEEANSALTNLDGRKFDGRRVSGSLYSGDSV